MRPPVSVCIATYNGEQYIEEQLASISVQLAPGDEVVVVDDCSSDGTLGMVEAFLRQHPGTILLRNVENRGHVAAFEAAMRAASHDIVVLSDQDDIWAPGRLDALANACSDGCLVVSRFETLRADGTVASGPALRYGGRVPRWRGLLDLLLGRAPYFGCTMAVHRSLLALVIPVPTRIEAHDLWFSYIALWRGELFELDRVTVMRRLHDHNLTPLRRRGFIKVASSRATYLVSLLFSRGPTR